MSFLDGDGEEERRRRGDRVFGAAEGGCCLLQVIGAVTSIALVGIIPLLVR